MNKPQLYTNGHLIRILGTPTIMSGGTRLDFERRAGMMLWDIPADINAAIPALPNRIYCNFRLIPMLEAVLRELMALGLHTEIRTWDGCFNVRKKMGTAQQWSTHSWGIAIDMNAAWNPWKGRVTWSKAFLAVFRKHGFIVGADWGKQKDGMHFQIGINIL